MSNLKMSTIITYWQFIYLLDLFAAHLVFLNKENAYGTLPSTDYLSKFAGKFRHHQLILLLFKELGGGEVSLKSNDQHIKKR